MTVSADDIVARREELLRRLDSPLVRELAARIVSHNERMTSLGHRASKFCAMGCARCCSMIFFVSPPEVEVIALYLLERPDLLELFLDNWRKRELRVAEAADLYARCQAATVGDDPALAAFYALDIRCAFNAGGACFIYPVRPLSCSLYNSIVPAETCATEPKTYETEEMRLHHGETRQWLASPKRRVKTRETLRLDVSRKVGNRLAELLLSGF